MKGMEDFYYAALYDVLRTPTISGHTMSTINKLKAKLRGLSCKQMCGVLLDTDKNETVMSESITIYHYARSRKRLKKRTVTQILDETGDLINDKKVYTFYL